MAEIKTEYSRPLKQSELKELRRAYTAQNNYTVVACAVLGGAIAGAGGVIAGAIGSGAGAAAGIMKSQMDINELNDAMAGLIAGTYCNVLVKSKLRYRNAGQNSGWYVSSVTVFGVDADELERLRYTGLVKG